MRWWLTLLLALAFLATGIYGAYAYVHNYEVYRGFPPPKDPNGVPNGKLVQVHFQSRALGHQDSYLVYEPPGYQRLVAQGTRFPVLYLLHGTVSNALHYVDVGRVGVALDELLHGRLTRPFLVVMPGTTDGSFVDDTEWANTSHGPYESEVMEIVRHTDSHFPTLPTRAGRGIAGLSMGGYGALNIGLHHLSLFSVIESWSGYFTAPQNGPFTGASPAMRQFNSPAQYAPTIGPALRRRPLHVYIYGGHQDKLTRYQHGFAAELRKLGASVRTAEPPGLHDWRLWRTQMPLSLLYAGHWLSPAANSSGRVPLGG